MAQKKLIEVKGERGKFIDAATGEEVMILADYDGLFFDTVALASGTLVTTVIKFFNALANKTAADTNLDVLNHIPERNYMVCRSLGFRVLENYGTTRTIPGDILAILENGVLEFLLNKTPKFCGPVTFLPPGYGPSGNTVETNQGIVSNGVPSPQAVIELRPTIEINDGDSIFPNLSFPDRASWATAYTQPTLTNRALCQFSMRGRVIEPGTKS